jgi:hypothetical protein
LFAKNKNNKNYSENKFKNFDVLKSIEKSESNKNNNNNIK